MIVAAIRIQSVFCRNRSRRWPGGVGWPPAVLQLGFLLPSLARHGVLPIPTARFPLTPGWRRIMRLMVPTLFGSSVAQISLLLDVLIASAAGDPAVLPGVLTLTGDDGVSAGIVRCGAVDGDSADPVQSALSGRSRTLSPHSGLGHAARPGGRHTRRGRPGGAGRAGGHCPVPVRCFQPGRCPDGCPGLDRVLPGPARVHGRQDPGTRVFLAPGYAHAGQDRDHCADHQIWCST